MGKFFRLLLQLWLLIAFGVLAAAVTHYVQAGQVEMTENVQQLTFDFPLLNQQVTFTLWQYTLTLLVIGSALTCVHFGFDAMRKTLIIRRLNKQIQASSYSATPAYGSSNAQATISPSIDNKTNET